MLSQKDREEIANRVRRIKSTLGLSGVGFLDMMTVITKVKVVFPEFNYHRKPDSEMSGREAYFEPGPTKNIIFVSESAYAGMNKGDSRYMRIFFEELGHFYLGHKFARNHSKNRSATEKTVFSIVKDEAEADYFAECFQNLP